MRWVDGSRAGGHASPRSDDFSRRRNSPTAPLSSRKVGGISAFGQAKRATTVAATRMMMTTGKTSQCSATHLACPAITACTVAPMARAATDIPESAITRRWACHPMVPNGYHAGASRWRTNADLRSFRHVVSTAARQT